MMPERFYKALEHLVTQQKRFSQHISKKHKPFPSLDSRPILECYAWFAENFDGGQTATLTLVDIFYNTLSDSIGEYNRELRRKSFEKEWERSNKAISIIPK